MKISASCAGEREVALCTNKHMSAVRAIAILATMVLPGETMSILAVTKQKRRRNLRLMSVTDFSRNNGCVEDDGPDRRYSRKISELFA